MNIFNIWINTFDKNIANSLIEEKAKNEIRHLIKAGVEVLLIEMNNSSFLNNNVPEQFLRTFFTYKKFFLYYKDDSVAFDNKKHIKSYIDSYKHQYDKDSMSNVFTFLNLRQYLAQDIPELVAETEKWHIQKQTNTEIQSSILIKKRL